MATKEIVKADIKRLVVGLNHSERERLALDLAEVASGESCQFLKCDSGTLTAYFPQEAARLAEGPGSGRKIAPTQIAQYGKELGEWTAALGRFYAKLHRGLIPPGEVAAARAAGLDAWHGLIRKYGAPDAQPSAPQSDGGIERALLDAGKDPDEFEATRGARTFAEYKRLKAAHLASKGAA